MDLTIGTGPRTRRGRNVRWSAESRPLLRPGGGHNTQAAAGSCNYPGVVVATRVVDHPDSDHNTRAVLRAAPAPPQQSAAAVPSD
jgi:hypothetical protein